MMSLSDTLWAGSDLYSSDSFIRPEFDDNVGYKPNTIYVGQIKSELGYQAIQFLVVIEKDLCQLCNSNVWM